MLYFYKKGGALVQSISMMLLVISLLFLIYALATSKVGIVTYLAFAAPVASIYMRNMLICKGASKNFNRLVTLTVMTVLLFLFLGGIIFLGILTAADDESGSEKAPLLISDLAVIGRAKYEVHFYREPANEEIAAAAKALKNY